MRLLSILLVCLFVSSRAFAVSASDGYQNKVVDIQEISTVTGFKYIISCEHDDPICSYAPESYLESQNAGVHRFFMPMTTVLADLSSSLDLYESDQGVEFMLTGNSIQKIISGNKILLVVHSC